MNNTLESHFGWVYQYVSVNNSSSISTLEILLSKFQMMRQIVPRFIFLFLSFPQTAYSVSKCWHLSLLLLYCRVKFAAIPHNLTSPSFQGWQIHQVCALVLLTTRVGNFSECSNYTSGAVTQVVLPWQFPLFELLKTSSTCRCSFMLTKMIGLGSRIWFFFFVFLKFSFENH